MKVNPLEIQKFMLGWPKGENYYMEDCNEDHWEKTFDQANDYTPRNPEQLVTLEEFDFNFAWQGKGDPIDLKPSNFVGQFKKWKKKQTHQTVIIDVPCDKMDEFLANLKTFNAKQVK